MQADEVAAPSGEHAVYGAYLLGFMQMRDIHVGDMIRLVGFGEHVDGVCSVRSIEHVDPPSRIITTVEYANGDTARVWHWVYSFVEPITLIQEHNDHN
jgi:hypothetical protein